MRGKAGSGRELRWACLVVFAVLFGIYVWRNRASLGIAIPAAVLAGAVGALGVVLYLEARRLAVGSRGWSGTEVVLAAMIPISVAGGLAAWSSGEWRGVSTVLGSLMAGLQFGVFVLLLRIALWGGPRPSGEAGPEPPRAPPSDRRDES